MSSQTICKISAERQVSLLSSVMLKIAILGGIYIYFIGFVIPDPIYLYIILFLFVIDILPTIILHLQYLYKSWNDVVVIDKLNHTISINGITHYFNDIKLFEYFASYGGGTGWYSFGEYRYYRIKFNDSSEVVISCLMMKDIKYTLETLIGMTAEKRLKIFPFMK